MHLRSTPLLLAALLCVASTSQLTAQTTAFTYQGELRNNGQQATGQYDLAFSLHDASSGGSQVGSILTNTAVAVGNGVFTVRLDFGAGVFTGADRWLQIAVRTNGDSGAFTTLSPRQALTPVPTAVYAMTPAGPEGPEGPQGPAGASPFILAGTNALYLEGNVGIGTKNPATALHVVGTVAANGFNGPIAATQLTGTIAPDNIAPGSIINKMLANGAVESSTLATGAVTTGALASGAVMGSKVAPGQLVRSLNTLRDDVVLTAGANITLHTNGNSLQISAVGGGGDTGWSLRGNAGTTAGTDFLGTTDDQPLELKVDSLRALRLEFWSNSPNMIVGQSLNGVTRGTEGSTIGGGGAPTEVILRTFPLPPLFIPHAHSIESDYATISGGSDNRISTNADYATIPGGVSNSVSAPLALAAGNRAKARHPGAFVWADSQAADFASTTANQFAVRAAGGIRFETGGAGISLDGQPVASGQITASSIADGTIGAADINAADFNTTFWRATGNSGTTPGSHFLGTTDNQALEFKVNGSRALRIVPNAAAPNLIGGASANSIGASAYGSVIGGGGNNTIAGNFDVTAGGFNNIVGSGTRHSTIGGGYGNEVAGSAWYATIPGGRDNTVSADYGFAAGNRAKANHTGAFVWADAHIGDFTSTANNQFLIRANGGVGINTNNPQAALHVNGETITTSLQIVGGADLAEPFPMSGEGIQPGSVVVIDADNPGHLKLSRLAYDKCVAGVVSGANGVNPGLTLRQTGRLEGGPMVALSGRVYALADASAGPIQPGDLLTTSNVPGHAMRVNNHARATGAIIGKAMTGLTGGRGLVLVLVNLQ